MQTRETSLVSRRYPDSSCLKSTACVEATNCSQITLITAPMMNGHNSYRPRCMLNVQFNWYRLLYFTLEQSFNCIASKQIIYDPMSSELNYVRCSRGRVKWGNQKDNKIYWLLETGMTTFFYGRNTLGLQFDG